MHHGTGTVANFMDLNYLAAHTCDINFLNKRDEQWAKTDFGIDPM